MKKVLVLGMALGAVVLLSTARSTVGQEKKANVQEASAESKDAASSKTIRDLEAASLLIQFGRREKHPESLLVAAQILHKTQTKPLGVERTGTAVKSEKAAPATDNSPKALVAEAGKMSSAPHVEALAAATSKILQEEVRGAVGGAKVDGFTIQPGQSLSWNPILFRGNERAEVYIDAGVMGRMALEVIDEFGYVVARDSQPGNYYRCVWYPRNAGNFRFRLINNDVISFRCGLATN